MNGFCGNSKYIWQDRGGYLSCAANDCRIFRRRFKLEKKPKGAYLRMFADSAYILYVNGVKIRRATAFSPDMPVCIGENIEKHLQAGENLIAVACMHRGYPAAFSDCRAPAMRLELELHFSGDRKEYIYSDSSFKVKENTAYGSLGVRFSENKGCIECADNRSDIYGWQNADYDDSGWENAGELELSDGIFGAPAFTGSYGCEEKVLPAKAIISAGTGSEREDMPYPASVVREAEDYKVNLVYGLGSECEIKPLDKGNFSYLTVDFGCVITGYLRLELESYNGDVADILFSEELKADKPVVTGMARFVARDSQNVFETMFDINTFRYVTIILRNHIRTNYLRKICAYTQKGFLSGEEEETRIANECIGEILLSGPGGGNMQDISCARYILDSCITPENPAYSKHILDMFSLSQNGRGFIKPNFPGVYSDGGRLGTVMYILAMCEYIIYTKDYGYARQALNNLIPALDACCAESQGGIAGDLGAMGNILLSGAVSKLHFIAKRLGEKILCEYLSAKEKKIKRAIKAKYLSNNGIYCDKADEDGRAAEASCDINAAAILYIASKKEVKALCTEVLDYRNKQTKAPSALHAPLFVKAARKAGREDIAEFVISEFEGDKAYFTAVCELKKQTGGK